MWSRRYLGAAARGSSQPEPEPPILSASTVCVDKLVEMLSTHILTYFIFIMSLRLNLRSELLLA